MSNSFNLWCLLSPLAYTTKVLIYGANEYGTDNLIFKGRAGDARKDDSVWEYLLDEIELLELVGTVLTIGVSVKSRESWNPIDPIEVARKWQESIKDERAY